ncbi:MAG: MurR/RpiR family transcriptional regulator [Lachnospiraceae bacterium]|nr:MurR/RpiR family transcriptional regulator [Lachnospiraceae bacterium]
MSRTVRKGRDVLALIRTGYNTLSKSQKAVADYVISNAEQVMTTSLAELADSCKVSEPTIFRFLRKLGYDSYQVFRVDLAQALAEGRNENFYSEIEGDDNAESVRDKVLAFTMRCFEDSKQIISAESLDILSKRIDKSRNIVTAGIGSSYSMAYDLYHKLMRLGILSQVTHDPHMLNILCSRLTDQDTLICFSHSGESREILDAMRIAHEAGAYTAAITSFKNSSAVQMADCTILSSSYETQFRADSMTSRILQLSIIDMIYIRLVLADQRRRQEEINMSRLAVARNKT